MKSNYLFSPVFKKIGWILFRHWRMFHDLYLCGVIHDLLPCTVFSIIPASDGFFGKGGFLLRNDGWEDEISIILVSVALLCISLRGKKMRTNIFHLRLESWIWSILPTPFC